ncbi:efflux RND transporter periplasmic adaptor subunit [Pseudoalteromonas luteoviolacea]|uniref:efflux RND transporter periplasmic adaptor subunit n=1 Tax=Pseudoalteromonas luteoviolacea TaxID=43657 RepID=UPI000690556B|nr:efflux RND transporter periplasmic adaptor subunit [Pseudoalteromonas luteoviolacea]
MRLAIKHWQAVGAFAALGILLGAFSGAFNRQLEPQLRSKPAEYRGEHYLVTQRDVLPEDFVSASLVARENTQVSSRVLAQLHTLEVRAGQLVNKGQLLATLEDTQLRASMEETRAQNQANEALLLQAKKQLARNEALFSKGLVASNQVDEWQSKVDELSARRMALAEQLSGAQAALSYTRLHAPLSGVVVERLQEPGSMLSPGVPILEIFNPASLQVSGAVRSSLAGELKVGDELQIELGALNKTVVGEISEIVPVADSLARQFQIKLDITPPNGAKPGMYAQIRLPSTPIQKVVIPQHYVQRIGQLTMVLVIEQGIKQRRLIRLGHQVGDDVVVISGLVEGEMLALTSI